MFLDFATTTIRGVAISQAKMRGEQIPEGWFVDEDGIPTTDPSGWPDGYAGRGGSSFQLKAGGLLPFGGHKGYALMLASSLLGRILSGADDYAEEGLGSGSMRHQGVTMIVMRADLFQPLAKFADRADELGRRMRAVPPAAGFQEVLVPGDPEHRSRATRQRDGIPIPDDVWQPLVDLASKLGVEVPAV